MFDNECCRAFLFDVCVLLIQLIHYLQDHPNGKKSCSCTSYTGLGFRSTHSLSMNLSKQSTSLDS